MKKTILIFTFLICGSGIFLTSCSEKTDKIPALLEAKKSMGTEDEKNNIKNAYAKAVSSITKNPDDLQQYINLAMVYISEGRLTGNNNYYSNAAMKMLDKVTENSAADKDIVFQALSLKSTVLLNMHQFKDAMDAAQKGVALNSFNSGIFGDLVDANVELGNYEDAVKDCDKMISIRPDLRSYSRASYLRQIFGQNAGAIEAMRMAVEAGMPGNENTEWARTHLGDLYLGIGNIDSAYILYKSSVVFLPDYPYALVGLAKVDQAKKNYDAAIRYTERAIRALSEAAFVSYLGDLYELKGDAAKAKEIRNSVVDLLEEGQKDEPADALVKHNVSRELASAYMNAGNIDKALQLAQTDLNMRPDNIDANELIAWIYYMKGDFANAKIHVEKMLATKTQNANTLYKAGLIYSSVGDASKGNELMHNALSINQYVDQRLINLSKPQVALNK